MALAKAEQKESPVSRSPNNDEGGGHGEGETRLQGSLLSGPERRLLDWIIPRLPRWVTPDLLTGSALAAMVAAGFAYAGSGTDPRLLHVVNIGLFIHWFGDSLDGGLARARNQSRPRYGFYVDHMSDALGAFAIGTGAAVSGIATPALAVVLLVFYLLLAVHSYLATYALGVFQLSFGPVGPTELRIALILCNLAILWSPTLTLAGREFLTFDVAGGMTAVALGLILFVQISRTTKRLYDLERV